MGMVLIVDDEILNRKIIGSIIRNHTKYKTESCSNGEEVIDFLRDCTKEELPEIILMDIKMSGLNGFETTKIIKEDEKTRNIPIIFITALSDIQSKIDAFKLGGVDYISKPFNKYELIERLRVHVKPQENDITPTKELRKTLEKMSREFEEVKEMKMEFLSNAFHDLRNPISIIQMYSETLLEETKGVLTGEFREFLEIINRTGNFMEYMISDLSYLSKLKMGKYILNLEEYDYRDVLREIIRGDNSRDIFRGVNLDIEDCSNGYNISIDYEKLEFAIENIIKKAKGDNLDKTEEIKFSVSCSDDEKEIISQIIFKGDFLSNEEIFESSCSISAVENEYFDTGFGLAIAKEVIEKHGGSIGLTKDGEFDIIYFILQSNKEKL